MQKSAEYRMVNKQLQSEIDYQVIGKHMKAIRRNRGMTQSVVAEKMKLGVKYYAALEAGTENISFSRLIQFACIMQCSSDAILSGCHPEYPARYSVPEDSCEERLLLNKLLDQSSDDIVKILLLIAQGLFQRKE